jgi:hypothetical protein
MLIPGFSGLTFQYRGSFRRAATVALALAALAKPVLAEQPAATLATLLDKAQIQDMLVDYYGQLGSGRDDFGTYYVEDGVLDVNGRVGKGKKGIEDLYKRTAAEPSRRPGTFRMVLTNLKVVVNGSAATADVIWTGVNSETVTATPQLVEQGREHDELVKRDGRWLFKLRVITSDGGLPASYKDTYKKR